MSAGPQRNTDLVPLDERLLYLRVLRAVIALATVLDATLLPHLLRKPFLTVATSALGYLLVCVFAELVWRLMQDGRVPGWVRLPLMSTVNDVMRPATSCTRRILFEPS